MKTYRLVEVDVRSIIDAWIEAKQAIRLLVNNLLSRVREADQEARARCGQHFYDVRLDGPDGQFSLKLIVPENAYQSVLTFEDHSYLQGLEREEKLREHWPVSFAQVKAVTKWLASLTEADVSDAIAKALEN